MKHNNTEVYYIPIQMKSPLGFVKNIKIDDPVYTFSEVMAHKLYVQETKCGSGPCLHLEEMNADMVVYCRAVFEIRQEYAIEYVEHILKTYLEAVADGWV